MKAFLNSSWIYRLMALFFSLLLFGYVNLDKINTTRQADNTNTQMLATRSQTIKVPLHINADTDQYFITGYPQKVKVKLSGPNALVTSAVNTQNFRVTADLTSLKAGSHTVKLTQSGINKDITVKIVPSTITVQMDKRLTQSFPIQVNVKSENLATGYTLGNPKLSQDTAQVSGARAIVKKVTQVVATVDPEQGTKTDIDTKVMLQAVDANGKALNVLITPQTVTAKIAVTLNKKTLPISLKTTGGSESYQYELSAAKESVTAYGTKKALASLDKFPVTVDVSKLTSSGDQTISLTLPDGVTSVDPTSLKVHVTVSAAGSSESNSASSTSTETASSATQSSASSSESTTSQNSSSSSSSQASDSSSSTGDVSSSSSSD